MYILYVYTIVIHSPFSDKVFGILIIVGISVSYAILNEIHLS